MQAIGAAVDIIHSLGEKLAPLLVELGHVHGKSALFDAKYFKLFKVPQFIIYHVLLFLYISKEKKQSHY